MDDKQTNIEQNSSCPTNDMAQTHEQRDLSAGVGTESTHDIPVIKKKEVPESVILHRAHQTSMSAFLLLAISGVPHSSTFHPREIPAVEEMDLPLSSNPGPLSEWRRQRI